MVHIIETKERRTPDELSHSAVYEVRKIIAPRKQVQYFLLAKNRPKSGA
jgi:hypothetical protein